MGCSKSVSINFSAIDELENTVKKYIFPILALTDEILVVNYWTSPTDKIKKYIYLTSNVIVIYPTLILPKFSFQISLNHKYDEEELNERIKIANQIMMELMSVAQYDYSKNNYPNRYPINKMKKVYAQNRYEVALEIGICNWLGGDAIYSLIHQLEKWALKTYEGKKVPFSFIINTENAVETGDETKSNANYIDFLKYNNAAVFTDGISSVIKLDYKGNVIDFYSITTADEVTGFAPYRFELICNKCSKSEIGIALQSNGDLLIFKSRKLLIAKISGEWKFINSKYVITKINEFVNDGNFANKVLESLLDVSFSHSGGCLAIIENDDAKKLYIKDDLNSSIEIDKTRMNEADYLKRIDAINKKKKMVKKLLQNSISEQFSDTDRKLRQELLALDGATIVDKDGKFLAVGAIVSVPGGSDEGGRAAAAKELSKYGLAIKISMDGGITGYFKEKTAFKLL